MSAIDALHDRFLNAGRIQFDANVRTYADWFRDFVSLAGEAEGSAKPLGTAIGLFLTLDEGKLPQE